MEETKKIEPGDDSERIIIIRNLVQHVATHLIYVSQQLNDLSHMVRYLHDTKKEEEYSKPKWRWW